VSDGAVSATKTDTGDGRGGLAVVANPSRLELPHVADRLELAL